MAGTDKIVCAICGAEIYPSQWLPERVKKNTAFPVCIDCQQKFYTHFVALPGVGYKIAVFFNCLFFNTPYIPEVANNTAKYSKAKDGVWRGYIAAYRAWKKAGNIGTTAADGVTDIRKAFDGQKLTLRVTDDMLTAEDYQSIERERKERWGDGPKEEPYTEGDYEFMEKNYDALTADRAYLSQQAEVAIVRICKWTLEQERCFNRQDYDGAKKIGDLIKAEKEGEQLRKKDELPQDRVRLDDIVQAIERAGLHIMDYDELCKELANRSFHAPYPYTRDAADQMLLHIRNCTAWNEDREEVDRLPDDFAVEDTLGEFAETPDEKEKQIYRDLDILPLNMPQKDEKNER